VQRRKIKCEKKLFRREKMEVEKEAKRAERAGLARDNLPAITARGIVGWLDL
jgi:hypothetical protein